MFRLVRFFVLTSAVAAAAIIVLIVVHQQNEVARLIKLAERQNVELARSFANAIWPRFSTYVTSASTLETDSLSARPETQAIHDAVRAASAGLPILKVKIYDTGGLTVYSSEPAEIGEDKTNNPGVFSAAKEGRPASRLTNRNTFSSFEGEIQERDLVESYLPIRTGDSPVEGVFELYTDVTPLLADIRGSTVNFVIGFIVIFGVVYGVLFLAVRRADQTIKWQYADITEKNAVLEHEVSERKQMEAALKTAHDELEIRVEARTRDLTEEIAQRKRVEDVAQRHRNELAQFGRISVMGEMATNLAHELNQPLTVISGCAQVCLDELRSDEDPRAKLLDSIEQVAEQADRANEIIKRIRGFVRKGDQELRKIDVNQTIHDIANLLESDARDHDTDIDLKFADNLPAVIADSIQIQQVILNLAHNGIEAMTGLRPEARQVTIETSTSERGVVEVVVRDKGPGIAADILERVFEPLYTTKANGLGMGLSISRSIVEAHGGRLWAESDGSGGAEFSFSLPTVEGSRCDGA